MTATIVKALILFLVGSALLGRSCLQFEKTRTAWALLQSIGAAAIVIVALAHVCEALEIFPGMQWGLKHSAGHYLDLSAAILGLTLLPLGFIVRACKRQNA